MFFNNAFITKFVRSISLLFEYPQQITTAITFLQNSSVKRNPLQQKQQFLRSKGLTEDEIQIACDRAGVFSGLKPGSPSEAGGQQPHSTVINMGISPANKYGHGVQPRMVVAAPKSLMQQVRDVLSSTALVAGVAYAVYLFYKVGRKNGR